MRYSFAASLVAITTVSAHSWLECTSYDNSEILPWMKGNSTLSPPVIVDPTMPWYSQFCHGWPRNKANPGNWIADSTNYVWNIAANSWNGGSYHPADTHACPPEQRSPTYQGNAPMPTAAPGDMIRLMFGGNGHSRGWNAGGQPGPNPGVVTVYWKGKPETEITDISEFTEENKLQSQGFSDNSFAYPADPTVVDPAKGLVDKGNWMNLNLPKDMAPGRHMMVWVWTFSNAPQWSTCFDVTIQGDAKSPVGTVANSVDTSAPAPAAPAASSAAPAPAPAAPAPAPAAPAPAAAAAPAQGENVVTVTEIIDVYTTVWNDAPEQTPSAKRVRRFQS